MPTEKSFYISIDLLSDDFLDKWPPESVLEEYGISRRKTKERILGLIFTPFANKEPGGVHLLCVSEEDETYRQWAPFFNRERTFHTVLANFKGPDSLKRQLFIDFYGQIS